MCKSPCFYKMIESLGLLEDGRTGIYIQTRKNLEIKKIRKSSRNKKLNLV